MIQTENTPSLFDRGAKGYKYLFWLTFWSAFPVCLNPGMGAATIATRLKEKKVFLKEHSKFILKNEIKFMTGNFELKKVFFAIDTRM